MLDLWLREELENRAIKDVANLLPRLAYDRFSRIVHYAFSLFVAIVSFCILFAAHLITTHSAEMDRLILMTGIVFCALLVIVSQILKRNASFIRVLLHGQARASNYLRTRAFFDPLYYQFHVTLMLLCLPLLVLWIVTVLCWNGTAEVWVLAGSDEHVRNLEAIKQFTSLALAITSAQIALFTFMFSYLLGRYSSQIVKSLITHRAVFFAWVSSIGALMLLLVYSSYGYPRALETLITPLFVSLTILCLIVTIWVCVSGIHPERAVLYAGARFGRTVRRRVKKSILVFEGKPSRFWLVLRWFGLDWRDQERMKLYEPPSKGLPWVSRCLASLFNAANKAIEENQQELLSHSLMAILTLLQSYVERRKSYYGSKDSVLTEANNQMAALLKAACNSSNEYMPTLIVRCIGKIGALSLQIEEQPPIQETTSPFGPVPKRHELSLLWAGLLEEAFELTHPLQRTTAPYEAISQLTFMGTLCHKKEYFDPMATRFFSNIQKMHAVAVAHADVYHRELGRKCLEAVMTIFALASQDNRKYSSTYRPFDQCLTALAAMAKGQFLLDALPDFNLNGCGSILTRKSSSDSIVLQDIFYATLSRPISEDWQLTMTISDLHKIISLVADLAQIAAMKRAADNGIFITAFYEISYLVLRGLPKSIENQEDSVKSDIPLFRPYISSQDELDTEVLTVWRQLFSIFFDNRIIGWDWEWYMCAVLGIGFANIEGRKTELLYNELQESVQHLRQHVVKTQSVQSRNIDHWWPYLQLLGAWMSGFPVKDAALSIEIAVEVGKLKPFRSFMHGSSGQSQFEPYGYPLINWGDFALPKPQNLLPQGYMSQDDIQQFLKWQASLMSSDLLLPYYEEVEKTRAPIREEYYKKLREMRTERENREQTEKEEQGE